MSREQREAAVDARDVPRHGPRQRQAVERAGAAPDLVHEDEALVGGVVQDVRGLGHLHHESGAPAGEIVAGADAREDAVDRARAPRRSAGTKLPTCASSAISARLAHVRRFAAHVRARDDQHAPRGIEHQVVGHEGAVDEMLDHRMPPAANLEARLGDQRRARSSRAARARSASATSAVERRQRGRGRLQRGEAVGELREHLLVELAFARQRFLARAEHLVLEALELGRDEALGVLHGLPADVVLGHVVRLRARSLR